MVNLPSKYEHVSFVTISMLPLSSITAMPTCGLHKAICMTVNCLNIWTHTQTAANITDAQKKCILWLGIVDTKYGRF